VIFNEKFINNSGVAIHFLDNEKESSKLPFVIVPGLSESADDYIDIMGKFSDRRCIAITLRGRGKSDAPETGYTIEDHISDIESVVNFLELEKCIMLGFSRGVSYSLGFTLRNLHKVEGLILGDYGAYQSYLPPEWVDVFSSQPPWRGKPLSERMKLHALIGLQRESKLVEFWDELHNIENPVLVIRGAQNGLLSESDSKRYLELLPNSEVVTFQESGHNIFEPCIESFVIAAKEFFGRLG
jgi:pimeloyl-ACP methyl ester carboxylesterase